MKEMFDLRNIYAYFLWIVLLAYSDNGAESSERLLVEDYDPLVTTWSVSPYCSPSSPPASEEFHMLVKKGIVNMYQGRIQNLHCRGGHKWPMKPKASLRRVAPKGGGWGRGSPPPAGGGPGVSPGKFWEICIKTVHSECILR